MSKIREILQLAEQGKSISFISRYLNVHRKTIRKYLNEKELLNLPNEELLSKDDLELDELFFGKNTPQLSEHLKQLYAYFPHVEKQLKRPGITKYRMWQEYKLMYPNGVQTSQFCEHYNRWSAKVNPVMRMVHKVGDKLYVDYAGKKLSIVDKGTGEVKEVQFFVAVLGASQYTYAEVTLTQKKEDFIGSLQRALHFFEGTPQAIVPDNLKSAVTKSSRYEPTINDTLLAFATHYGTTILPARVYKPKDKSLVEGAVKILYRRIYAELQDDIFHSLQELNQTIWEELKEHNSVKLTGRPYSRLELFDEMEKTELMELPAAWFQIREQRMATVMTNGHVLLSVDKHYYSVPYRYIKKKVKLLYGQDTVEVYHKYLRIAVHTRNYRKYDYSTLSEHLASTHRFISEWTPQRFTQWAADIDEYVLQVISKVLESKQHPEQAYKSCMGILSLLKKDTIGKERLVNACKQAIRFGSYSYQAITNILDRELDKEEENEIAPPDLPDHGNIRGKDYYK
ncbi:MAG: IS21 family transposase [Cyclobacteriaceae bacterium]|nr:IS21 family transposase [Cyclobacteriaceae bacterium]